MARGRTGSGRAELQPSSVPPPLRVRPNAIWRDYAGALAAPDAESRALLAAFNENWRVRGARIGSFSSGSEQGYRITRYDDPATTVWFSGSHNVGEYVVYALIGAFEHVDPFGTGRPAPSPSLRRSRRLFGGDEMEQAQMHIATLLSAESLPALSSAARDRRLSKAMRTDAMPRIADFMNRR